MFTDPIADMLTRIRNGIASHKEVVVIPYSKLKYSLAEILAKEGYIAEVVVRENTFKELHVTPKYDKNGEAVITGIQRVSKPGQRIYSPVTAIPRSNGGLGITIVSTSHGLMTDRSARKQKFGGEVVCQVW